MCHEWFMRRERRQREEERFDEELRYLLDDRRETEPPMPVVEHESDEDFEEAERPPVRAS